MRGPTAERVQEKGASTPTPEGTSGLGRREVMGQSQCRRPGGTHSPGTAEAACRLARFLKGYLALGLPGPDG